MARREVRLVGRLRHAGRRRQGGRTGGVAPIDGVAAGGDLPGSLWGAPQWSYTIAVTGAGRKREGQTIPLYLSRFSSSFETTVLLTVDETMDALRRTRQVQQYRAPGA